MTFKIKAALNKLKEVKKLYRNVKLDSVEKSAEKDLVIEKTGSASSEMVRRVKIRLSTLLDCWHTL